MNALFEAHGCSYAEGLARQEAVRLALPSDTLHALAFEHPPTFTFGRHAKAEHLLVAPALLAERGVAVAQAERGGEVTFHGPGQLVFYPVFRLGALGTKAWVALLEQAMIAVLARYGVSAQRGEGPGVFVGARKIGFVGLRIRDGVSTHGISLNLFGDLEPFTWMNPCGAAALPVTSIARETDTPPALIDCARAYMDTLSRLLIGHRV